MNIKSLFLTLCLSVALLSTSAQIKEAPAIQPNSVNSFGMSTALAFGEYYKHGGIQEKLYLITDKSCYSAGDSIYFSAYLLNPVRFTPAIESSFLYVELISADGRLITRLKVLGDKGRFANKMDLSTKMDAGRYTLRAYSKWMGNFDKEFLFSKVIEIGNYIDDSVQPKISYKVLKEDSIAAEVIFTDNMGEAIADTYVEYTLNLRGKSKVYASKTDQNGRLTFKFRPSNNIGDCLHLKITANSRLLERTIQLPTFSDDFALQFMPEGGNLIAGISQVVAFKAIGTDGKPVDIEGSINSKDGTHLCDIKSMHHGMGRFVLMAQADQSYTATVTSSRGITRTFTLPTALATGCMLQVKQLAGNILMMKVTATPDLDARNFAAIIQSRGMVEAVLEDVTRLTRIPLTEIMSGIAQISIVDKVSKQIVAERLIFVENHNFASATITPNKSNFSPREKISLNFDFRNSAGTPVVGDFVVSVTDSKAAPVNPMGENILSYLLLSSDLPGTIEEPAAYFDPNNPQRKEHLDLLMLTHGWRRYDLSKILKGEYPLLRYKVEDTQRITGGVLGMIGKVKNPSVMIFQKGDKIHGIFPLNSSNRFEITGIDAPDTAYYYIQALNKNGNSNRVRIQVDPETYPSTNIPLPRPYYKHNKPSVTEDLLMGAKQKYYDDGGMRVVDIDAIVVTAKYEKQYSYSTVIDGFNSLSGDLSRYASVYDALQRFRQLYVNGTDVRVRKFGGRMEQDVSAMPGSTSVETAPGEFTIIGDPNNPNGGGEGDEEERIPSVLINDSPADIMMLDMYPMEEIVKLAYVGPEEAMGLSVDTRYGVIIMEVKDINHTLSTGNESMAKVLVAGYCKPAEFYAPRYDVPQTDRKKDLRTTIAWEPSLRSDATGKASMSFWSADRRNDYDVIVEGITADGELCRATYRLKANE